jgi:hypothetical protein
LLTSPFDCNLKFHSFVRNVLDISPDITGPSYHDMSAFQAAFPFSVAV